MVSGYLGELRAVECIKQGAADYVLKDHLLRLPESVRRALREKKLREEHRRTLEDLARSNRDLEQFAYVASHDLQEPLRMVAIYTQLLAERYRGKLDPEADKYIYYAVDGATRMQTLVKDLLAFSRVGRPGHGVQTRRLRRRDRSRVEESAHRHSGEWRAGRVRPSAGRHGGFLPTDPTLPEPDRETRIKFRGPEPPVVRITAETAKQEVIFSVADNGIGIAPEHADFIFVIFKRLHTRAEYPGSGIGLSICKKIVERHGGRIWVESRAWARMHLPLYAARRERGEHTAIAINTDLEVLLVDDNQADLDLTHEELRKSERQFSVNTALTAPRRSPSCTAKETTPTNRGRT